VDIVFAKCKPPGSRRLSHKEFLEAINLLAEEAGWAFGTVGGWGVCVGGGMVGGWVGGR
jgi:hypothetical protein